MAITLNASDTKTAIADDSTTLTITKPTNLANNDVLLAFITDDDNQNITPPTDWVTIDTNLTGAGQDMGTGIYYKVISNAAGEPADYTWTVPAIEDWAGGILRLTGVDNTTPSDVTNSHQNGVDYDDTTDHCLSITTATNGAMYFAFLGIVFAQEDVVGVDGMINCITAENGNVGTDGASVYVDYATKATAGATGNKLYVIDTIRASSEWHTYQCAMRPAAPPAGNAGIMTTNTGFWGPTF